MDFLLGSSGDGLQKDLLPNKIQEKEDIGSQGRKPSISGDTDGDEQQVDSDGNRVNVGNFDDNGLNVNNNWDDNRNDNIGVSSARQSIGVFLLIESASI